MDKMRHNGRRQTNTPVRTQVWISTGLNKSLTNELMMNGLMDTFPLLLNWAAVNGGGWFVRNEVTASA